MHACTHTRTRTRTRTLIHIYIYIYIYIYMYISALGIILINKSGVGANMYLRYQTEYSGQ